MRLTKRLRFSIAVVIGWLAFNSLRGSSVNGQGGTTSSSSSNAVRGTLNSVLTNAGYSARQAYFWFLISNMETAGFTSNLFKNFNNLVGMKQPAKRSTTSTGGTASGFASFASVHDAALDLAFYLEEFNYPADFKTLSDQIVFMRSKGYFGNETLDSYRGKVVAWANKYGYPISPSPHVTS